MSAIPQAARDAVAARSQGRCERCFGRGTDIHHRQRRREGHHAVENLVFLCRGDHAWAHANPTESRTEGFVIPTWVPRESIHEVPLTQFNRTIYLRRDGTTGGEPR